MPPSVFGHRLEHRGVDRTQQILAEVLGLGEQNVDQLFCLLLQAVELRLDLLLAFSAGAVPAFPRTGPAPGRFPCTDPSAPAPPGRSGLAAFSSFDIRSASIPANWTARSSRIW